jgi:hypothetical protein
MPRSERTSLDGGVAQAIRRPVLLALALALTADRAAALELLSDGRYSQYEYTDEDLETIVDRRTPDASFGSLERPVSYSSSITFDPDGLGFAGDAFGFSSYYNVDFPLQYWRLLSFFSIGFRIEGEGSLSIGGAVHGSAFDPAPYVRVLAGGNVLYQCIVDYFSPEQSCPPFGVPAFSFSSPLPPGDYVIEAATATFEDAGDFDFTFSVRDTVPIPESGTGLAVAAGLVSLAARRR